MPDDSKLLAKGSARHLPISSCKVTSNDLRTLYKKLEDFANQAAEKHLSSLLPIDQETPEAFSEFKKKVAEVLKLLVRVQSPKGEWVGGTTAEVLSDDSLLSSISRIEYSSDFLFRGLYSYRPNYYFTVTLDFRDTNLLDFTNSPGQDPLNESVALISGADMTWVDGVYQQLNDFFKEKKSVGGWLHYTNLYQVLLFVLGIPLGLAWVSIVDRLIRAEFPQWSSTLFIGANVYIFFLFLFVFRITFNYARWMFPKVEGPRQINRPKKHRVFLGGLILSLFSGFLKEMLFSLLK